MKYISQFPWKNVLGYHMFGVSRHADRHGRPSGSGSTKESAEKHCSKLSTSSIKSIKSVTVLQVQRLCGTLNFLTRPSPLEEFSWQDFMQ